MVGRDQGGPFRGEVAADHIRPGGTVGREVDAGRHGRERGGAEKDRDADADFDFRETAQPQDRRGGIAAQAFGDAEIGGTQGEQHQEHGDLGADHDAVGGAVERLEAADVEPCHRQTAGQDCRHAGHGKPREAGTDQAQRGAIP